MTRARIAVSAWGFGIAVVLALGCVSWAGDLSERECRRNLKSLSKYVREKAIWCLVNLEARPKDAMPLLVNALLHDPEESVRTEAAAALGAIGPPAVSVVPVLLKAAHDQRGPKFSVNDAAEKALSQIGPVAIPLLKDALCGEYGAGSGKALAGMGTRALPTLIEGLKTEGCRAGAAIGVGQMGPMAASAVPALIAAVADNSRDVRTWSVRAPGQIGPQAKDAVPVLIATLKDSDKWVRLDAVVALGKIGPAARPAIPGLRAMLSDPDQQIRLNAQATLKAIEAR